MPRRSDPQPEQQVELLKDEGTKEPWKDLESGQYVVDLPKSTRASQPFQTHSEDGISHLSEDLIPFSPTNITAKQSINVNSGKLNRKGRNPLGYLFRRIIKPKQDKSNTTENIHQENKSLLQDQVKPTRRAKKSAYGATTSTNQKAESKWAIVRQKLKEGEFLLQRMVTTPDELAGNETDKIQNIRDQVHFRLWHGILAIVIYLGITILCHPWLFQIPPEDINWTSRVIDSCYFAITTFTTVGYGDLVPTSDSSMLITCVYALTGVACLGVALGILGSNLLEYQASLMEHADGLWEHQVLSVLGHETEENPSEEKPKRRVPQSTCCRSRSDTFFILPTA